MSTILQDILGLLTRRKTAKLKEDDYFVIGRYATPLERLKPKPKLTDKVVSSSELANYALRNGLVTLLPYNVLAGAGGSSTMPSNYNIIDIMWDGLGSGVYTLNLPTATSMKYRAVRITTDGTLDAGAADKIDITPAPGDTIDGGSVFQISKRYEGLMIWSDGSDWIIIQAKSH